MFDALRVVRRSGAGLLGGMLLAGLTLAPGLRADQAIYTDSLQNGWQNWGWATLNYNNPSPVHSGSASISVTITGPGQAIYMAHSAFNSSPYTHLSFWLNGGAAGGQRLQVQGHAGGNAMSIVTLPALAANTWQQFNVSLAALGVANRADMDGFWIQERVGSAQPVFYVDDVSLASLPTVTLTAPVNGTAFTQPATIDLSATVVTNGRSITRVQFYNGAGLLGEDTAPPYTWSWSGVGAGFYTLSARAVYDAGSTVDSPPVNVVVATNEPVSITVDGQPNRHPINPLIYGVAFASSSQVADLNAPLNRSGGNSETRYNWQLNAHNTANDWYFESSLDSAGATPGATADNFVAASKNGGAEPMLTIPMIGWTTKLGTGNARLASFSVARYGPQTATDPWWSDAGNGISATNGAYITNNPNDASFATNSTFQRAYVQHLTNRWGLSTNGGVRYYLMDNEQTLWHSTHRDVHPVGTTMQEIRDKFFDYAAAVKAVDPGACVLAPEEWGWMGYFYSGYDQQWAGVHQDWNPAHFPDRGTNGGWDYIPWLLQQFRQRATNTNQRLLDYCTVHIYPQNGEFGDDVSMAMQLTRNRSTRSLWDPAYRETNWIQNYVKLIPRLKGWVATNYPGTGTGITEYNWGAEGHINGATAQADIYGIFGRENLDLGARWTTPASGTPTYKAMKMYRNYDGNHSGFGDTSVSATVPNPDLVAAFAAQRSADSALTVMLINKQPLANALATVNVTNCWLAGTGQVWQLTAINAIQRLSDISFASSTFTQTVPPQSITLLVLASGTPPPPRLRVGAAGAGGFDFWLDGAAGQRYVIESTSNFGGWSPVQTNTLTSNSWHIVAPVNLGPVFYRGKWAP